MKRGKIKIVNAIKVSDLDKLNIAPRGHIDNNGNVRFTSFDFTTKPVCDINYYKFTRTNNKCDNKKAETCGSFKKPSEPKPQIPEITIDMSDFWRDVRHSEMKFISKELNVRVCNFKDIAVNPINKQYEFVMFDNGDERKLLLWSDYYDRDELNDEKSQQSYDLLIQNLYQLLKLDLIASSKEVFETLAFTIRLTMTMTNNTFKNINEVFYRAIDKKLKDMKVEILKTL